MPSQSDLRFSFEALAVGSIRSGFVRTRRGHQRAIPTHLELISFDADVDFGLLLDKPGLFTVWRGEQARHARPGQQFQPRRDR